MVSNSSQGLPFHISRSLQQYEATPSPSSQSLTLPQPPVPTCKVHQTPQVPAISHTQPQSPQPPMTSHAKCEVPQRPLASHVQNKTPQAPLSSQIEHVTPLSSLLRPSQHQSPFSSSPSGTNPRTPLPLSAGHPQCQTLPSPSVSCIPQPSYSRSLVVTPSRRVQRYDISNLCVKYFSIFPSILFFQAAGFTI